MCELKLATAAVAIAGVCVCSEPGAAPQQVELPSQVVEGFVLHENSSGERLYTLEAETAYVYEAEERVDVRHPYVRFYDHRGEVSAALVSDHGVIHSKTEDLVAQGSVVVRTTDSTKLATDSLAWSNRARLVRTDSWVSVTTPTGHIEGQGLVADAGLTRIEIQSEVRGTSSYRFTPGEADSQ